MPDRDGATIGNIRDLTDQVIARTMDMLRTTLPTSEITALEELVASGEFLNSAAVLSAITQVQAREAM